jgi:dinuclear metal center YbgI/SA1388 family protein
VHANASLAEIVRWLDEQLDVARYAEAEPDSNGLLHGASTGDGVSKFAVAVSTSLAALMGAAKCGANLLIVHHPPWPGADLHLRDEKLAALDAANLSLYAAHASLDNAPRIGNGWALADVLGVTVDGTFAEHHGGHAGVYGRVDGSFAEFIARTQRQLGVEVEAQAHAKPFGRVALVPGGGGDTAYVDAARQLGCDTFVTGEGSLFTRMFAKECGVNLILATHQATEAPGVRALGARLTEHAGIPWEFIDESPDVF